MTAYEQAKVPEPNVAAIKEKTEAGLPPALKVFYPYLTGDIKQPAKPPLPFPLAELVGESATSEVTVFTLLLCASRRFCLSAICILMNVLNI